MSSLDEKRLRLLRAIGRAEQEQRFPVMRELAHELGYSGESSIRRLLDGLVAEGFLCSDGGGAQRLRRLFRLTDKARHFLPDITSSRSVPVLGSIPAGPLAEAVQECDEFVAPGDFLRVHSEDFFLRVTGHSMTGDGILPGDLVLLRPGVQINNGEIAAVQIQGANQHEATLKHIYWHPGKRTVRLHASNPAFEDVTLSAAEVSIVGVFRGLLRRAEG